MMKKKTKKPLFTKSMQLPRVAAVRAEPMTSDAAFERWAKRAAMQYTSLTTDNMEQAEDDAVELIGLLRMAWQRGALFPQGPRSMAAVAAMLDRATGAATRDRRYRA